MPNFRYTTIISGLILAVYASLFPPAAFGASDGNPDFARTLTLMSAGEITELGDTYLKRGMKGENAASDSALACYTEIIDRIDAAVEKTDPETFIMILSRIAYIYSHHYYDYREAYSYLMRAEKVAVEHNLEREAARVTADMAFILSSCYMLNVEHGDAPEKTEANRLLLKAMKLGLDSKIYIQGAYMLYNIIDLNFPENEDIIRKGIEYYRKYSDDGGNRDLKQYFDMLTAGVESFYDKDYKKAERHFKSSGDLIRNQPEGSGLFKMFAMWLCAMNEMAQGNLSGCERILLEIDNRITASGSVEMELAIAHELYRFYSKTGNKEAADRNLLRFFKARDKVYSSSNVYSVTDIKLKGELDENRRYANDMREKRQKTRRALITITAVSLLLIACLVWGLIYYRKRQALVMELYKKNLALINDAGAVSTRALSGCDKTTEFSETDKKLISKIDEIISRSNEVFDPGFSLGRLCEILNSNTSYVSRAINEGFGKSFKTLVSERRIFEACKLIDTNSPDMNFSVEGIGLHVGYRSRVTFTRAFKSVTGLTPSAYMDASKKHARSDNSQPDGDDL